MSPIYTVPYMSSPICPYICILYVYIYMQARSHGVGRPPPPPPVAHPKDFVPPFSNFVPPFSNFVPPFSNFALEYVDDVTRAMSKGGVPVNVQEWGRFSN